MTSKIRRTFALLRRTRGAARPAFVVGLLAILAALAVMLMPPAPQASGPIVAYNEIGGIDPDAGLASTPWPMFHQNLLHTGLSPYDTSANIGTLKWKFTTGGHVISSAAVGSDGTIYIGSDDYGLHALNPDGSQKWAVFAQGQVASSPAVGADGTIYVGSYGDSRVWAINPGGSASCTGSGTPYACCIGIAEGDALTSSGDAATQCGTKWELHTNYYVESSPAVASDGTIYIGSTDGNLYAINPGGSASCTGSGTPYACCDAIAAGEALTPSGEAATQCGTKWAYAAGSMYPIEMSSPAVAEDGSTIYIESGLSFYAIKSDGTQKWKFGAGGGYSSPALGKDGTIYVGSGYPPSSFFAITDDGTSAKEKWEFGTGGNVTSSPAIGADGTIYVGCDDSNVYALTDNGTSYHKKWAFKTGNIVYSSPAVGKDGTIYVGSYDDNLYAITDNGTSATKKWEYTTGDPIENASPAIGSDGTIYIGSDDGNLYAIGSWVTASPTSLSFGKQKVDTPSAAKKVTYTNKGKAAITIRNIIVSGDFAKSAPTCGGSLGAGASCSVSVTFTPSKTGARTGTLTVTASASFPTVPLSGTGIQ